MFGRFHASHSLRPCQRVNSYVPPAEYPQHAALLQALETHEARAARSKRVAEKLSLYKQQAGLVVDPAAEAAAQEAYNRGQDLMREVSLHQRRDHPI